jgi:hypothetical protein
MHESKNLRRDTETRNGRRSRRSLRADGVWWSNGSGGEKSQEKKINRKREEKEN